VGSPFVNAGFVNNTANPTRWVWFSTRGTSGSAGTAIIKTSVRTAAGIEDFDTAVTFGEWHVFKIVWTPGAAEFWVDGALVDTRSGFDMGGTPLHLGFFKSAGSATTFPVDWGVRRVRTG
jgi:hypothetical protein